MGWPNTGGGGAGGVTAVTATLPLTSSGGAAPNLAANTATGASAGIMAAADKTKLDALATISSAASPLKLTAGILAIDPATDVAPGSLSAADKTKLDATGGVLVAAAHVTTVAGASVLGAHFGISALANPDGLTTRLTLAPAQAGAYIVATLRNNGDLVPGDTFGVVVNAFDGTTLDLIFTSAAGGSSKEDFDVLIFQP